MQDSTISGLSIVLLAGTFQGSFLLPAKWIKGWAWENYWLIFAATAYLACPWALAVLTIPALGEVYRGVSLAALASVVVFGTGWGAGAVTFGLGVDALGLASGFAIILGVAAVSGTLIPFLVHAPAQLFSRGGLLTLVALGVMLLGVAVCSLAGKWKEGTGPSGGSYRRGVLLCTASGLLSACGNLGFAFGAEITKRAESLGASEHLSGNALWSLLALPLFFCNAGYSIRLLRRNRTMGRFRSGASGVSYLLAVSMGLMWMAGMSLYGMGAARLGKLGPSLGWAILMSTMVLVANMLGMATGEWSAAPRRAKRQLAVGVAILLLAIAALGGANYQSSLR